MLSAECSLQRGGSQRRRQSGTSGSGLFDYHVLLQPGDEEAAGPCSKTLCVPEVQALPRGTAGAVEAPIRGK